jgi:hypothetical protein
MEDVRQITLFYVMLLLYQFILLWVTSTALCFYRKDSAEKPDIGVPTRCVRLHMTSSKFLASKQHQSQIAAARSLPPSQRLSGASTKLKV